MSTIQIYSTSNCPNCRLLKQLLKEKNILYKEIDMATPAGLTELRMNGRYDLSAPILQIGNRFYILSDGIIIPEVLDQVLRGT